VQIFCKALRLNRRREVLDQAVVVSLGIRDALGMDGKLIQGWLATGDEPKVAKTRNLASSPRP